MTSDDSRPGPDGQAASVIYGELSRRDAPALAEVHIAGFPGFFLSSLGTPFLEELYRGYADDASAICVVARQDGQPIGVVIGTSAPAGFYRALLRRRAVPFAIAGLRGAAMKPRTLIRLARAVRYRGDAPPERPGALLSSIVVRPEWAGSGVGGELMRRWLALAREQGCPRAYLTTDADHNETAQDFYLRHGWRVAEAFETPEGRSMIRLETDLQGNVR